MRCEAWTRKGGAFTFGPPTWSQCTNDAAVTLKVQQEEITEQHSCMDCWNKAKDAGIKILSADPLK